MIFDCATNANSKATAARHNTLKAIATDRYWNYGWGMDEKTHITALIEKHRKILGGVLLRISVYYLILAGLIAIMISVFPNIVDELPLGGVGEIANYDSSAVLNLEDAFLTADDEELEGIVTETARVRSDRGPVWLKGVTSLFYAMFSTLLLMLPVSWVYKSIHSGSVYDHSIDTTALVLPAVVAGIVTMVQHSLALAFSLAGIVAGVRFRRALSDTFDTLFILSSIGVGIAAGIKSIEIAVVLTVFFNYAAVFVCMFGDGLESQHVVQQKLRRKIRKAERALEGEAKADPIDPMSTL